MRGCALIAFIQDLAKFVVQEPLVETQASIDGLAGRSVSDGLFFGVGLSNGAGTLSERLPFDVLSMLLVSERIAPKKSLLIADTHALTNGLDNSVVDRVAGQHKETLQRIIGNLGLRGWDVFRSSERDSSDGYLMTLHQVQGIIPDHHAYIQRQLTDMAWLSECTGADLKLGWVTNGDRNKDERFFDGLFREKIGKDLSFVYVSAGRTFDPKRIRAPPYHCSDPKDRIILDRDENVSAKIAAVTDRFGHGCVKPYFNLLSQIVRSYEKNVERIGDGAVPDRVQHIIGRCLA